MQGEIDTDAKWWLPRKAEHVLAFSTAVIDISGDNMHGPRAEEGPRGGGGGQWAPAEKLENSQYVGVIFAG